MRISDWSSDVCSSDLRAPSDRPTILSAERAVRWRRGNEISGVFNDRAYLAVRGGLESCPPHGSSTERRAEKTSAPKRRSRRRETRSEEHTSELQSLMRISYAVFCLKKKRTRTHFNHHCQTRYILNSHMTV